MNFSFQADVSGHVPTANSQLTSTDTHTCGSQSAVPRYASSLAQEALNDIQDFLSDERDAESASSSDSSSDSSDDEFEDHAAYLKSINLNPAEFRASFLGSTGLHRAETKKLVRALRTVNTDLFEIQTSAIKVKGPVVKPLDAAKNYLADHYFNKYGIHILPATGANTEAERARVVFSELLGLGEKPFGLVLSPLIAGKEEQRTNYRGHVLPILVHRSGNEVHLIELNSASPDHGVLAGLGEHLPALLAQNSDTAACVVSLHQLATVAVPNIPSGRSGRQVDRYSCHTDAMQILKDALVLHEKTMASAPISQLFPEHASAFAIEPSCPRRMIGLPASLLKTAQYPVFVNEMGGARESLAHREKYTVHPHEGSPVNHFLLLKALRNSTRIAQHCLTDKG